MDPRREQRHSALHGLVRRGLPLLLAALGVGTALALVAVRYEPRWVAVAVLGASLTLFLVWSGMLLKRQAQERDAAVDLADELRRAREQLGAILDGVADGITVQDDSGRLVHANEAAARAIGFSSARELLSTPVAKVLARFEILDDEGLPFPLEELPGRLALEGKEAPGRTLRYRDRGTGDERWSFVRATPLRDPDGQVRHAINIFQDITDDRWSRQSSQMLAEISEELLARSLDYEGTLRLLAELVVPRLGDIASVFLVHDGTPQRVQVVHRDREAQTQVLKVAAGTDPALLPDHPVHEVIATGEPRLIQEIPEEMLLEAIPDPGGREIVRGLELGSVMVVPLASRGTVLGALTLATTRGRRRYDEKDLTMAVDLARRAALAVETARLHMKEQEARQEAEATAGRMARLQMVTSNLAAASSVEEVAEALLGQAFEALGATSGSMVIRDESTLRLVGAVGFAEETKQRWERFPLDAPVPLAQAIRTGDPVLLTDPGELRESYPHLAGAEEPVGKAWAALPLMASDGRALGAVGLTFAEPRAFHSDERRFLQIVSEQCAQAVERARLYDAEREARTHAVHQQERLNFLAEASEILSGSLRYERTLEHLLDLCVPRLADWCVVDVLEPDGSIQQLSVAHTDPEKTELIRELRRRYPPGLHDHPIPRVIETGSPEFSPYITQEELRASSPDEDHFRLVSELGITGHMIVPLPARRRILGAISFVSGPSGRRFTHADLALAEELARRAALALDNARLYRERSQVARSLQQSLLPASLPTIPGAEVAARYRPAAEGDVGGDFYDIFEVGDGRWALLIGDVAGKGPEAAALTALARHTIRTAWLERDRDPEEVLRILHEVILREEGERFCTLALGTLDLSTHPHKLVLASGGHPPPLLLHTDGSVEALRVPGMLVGAISQAEIGRREFDVHRGEALLLYTDGIGDVGRPSQVPVEGRLTELLRLCVGLDAELMANRIERHALSFESASDDAAVVVIRIPEPPR